jgi:hypothetical protein
MSMPKRREQRITMPISVRIWGLDAEGKVFSQNAKTVNITPGGARLFGVTAKLDPGFTVGLQCGSLKGRFVVVWVGHGETANEGQIGLRAVETGIWGVPLPKPAEDYFAAWLDEEFLAGES